MSRHRVVDRWDAATLQARIADPVRQERFPAGSPNDAEIAAYRAGLETPPVGSTLVVLGMTPELRRLALDTGARLVSVDRSAAAIACFANWVGPGDRAREAIVQADWSSVSQLLQASVAAVLGDGVFGNLPDLDAHRRLLRAIHEVLQPGGRFVTRQALIPRGFDPEHDREDVLLARYRRGDLDDAEFGFAHRLLGHYACCYEPSTGVLDNARLFAKLDEAYAAGRLRDAEYRAARRYVFTGRNIVPAQDVWEGLLADAGFAFEVVPVGGPRKDWYRYYPVYACHRGP